MSTVLLPKNARQIIISGPEGALDTLELSPKETVVKGVAIVFHPDPKGGGTYTNKIVQTIAKVLNKKDYICYCPNLRGVGMSAGEHDFGNGEVEDGIAVYDYIKSLYPNLPIVFAGFSFGTAVASNVANKVGDYEKLLLIGPAVTRYSVVVPDKDKTLVIHGEDDEVIELS
ncbi:MAG: alpha/beta hydrolase, partial [Burkholderiales bacterium]|nr:alpha/beta hydrolase [Burkholderiales bacterium]